MSLTMCISDLLGPNGYLSPSSQAKSLQTWDPENNSMHAELQNFSVICPL